MMSESLFFFIKSALITGVGATLLMDIWAVLLKYALGIPSLNYALVGRWLGYISKGVFIHENINETKPISMEVGLGWISHYLIGIIFSGLLIIVLGESWINEPLFLPALIFGILTVVFPFFLMQPCLGLGIAGAKTPNPAVTRFKSLFTHMVFGVGLYFSAIINTFIF